MSVVSPVSPTIAQAMMEVLNCLCEQLAETSGGAVCWCGLWQGDPVPWDYCDACDTGCGMAYARVTSVFPYDTFPVPAIDQTCMRPLAYAIEVGVLRCFPLMDDDGSLPQSGVVSDATLIVLDDIEAMRKALQCCARIADVWLGEYTPLNEGGCAGGSFGAFINLEP